MADEQRICIKFCYKIGFTQEETCDKIREAFGGEALKKELCREIYRKFKKIEKFICENPCCSIEDICYENVDVPYKECLAICTDLNMRIICSKYLVPKLLTSEDKQERLDVCRDLRACAKKDTTYISRIITGIVHHEFVSPNQKIDADFYCDVLKRLEKAVRKERRKMWDECNWLLHHDNAPSHTARKTKDFLRDNKIEVVPHPANSPDLAPCDFFLFNKIKKELKKHPKTRYKTVSKEVLDSLRPKDFQKAFKEWQERWDQCLNSNGDYFE